ncbi:MAG: hypothetical protein CL920_34470 [Deltaproteobacteria bacterium]|nr:hypothetical protein [Deltaproteobacteria bacterium]MBU53830.1 hypothetical protein [Deltaproteobacteria bacterium]
MFFFVQAQTSSGSERVMLYEHRSLLHCVGDLCRTKDEQIRAIARLREIAQQDEQARHEICDILLQVSMSGATPLHFEAMLVLGRLRFDEDRVVSMLFRRMRLDDSLEARGYAAIALGYFGVRAQEIVPLLCDWLSTSPYVGLRVCAAIALGHFGERARSAVPLLIDALELQTVFARRRDSKFLRHFHAIEKAVSLPDLSEDFQIFPKKNAPGREFRRLIREAAVTSLGRMGTHAQEAIPGLLCVLRREPPWLQTKSAHALGEIGCNAPSVLHGLRRELHSPDEQVKSASAMSLRKLGDDDPLIMEVLLDVLKGQLQDLCWIIDEDFLLEVGQKLQDIANAILEGVPALQRLQMLQPVHQELLDQIDELAKFACAELEPFVTSKQPMIREQMEHVWLTFQEIRKHLAQEVLGHWRLEYEQVLFGS